MQGKARAAAESSVTTPSKRRSRQLGAEAADAWLQNLFPRNSFVCPICSKGFSSSQALGGHQNAHRKERIELRRLYAEKRLRRRRQETEEQVILESVPLVPLPGDDENNINDHLAPPMPEHGSANGPAGIDDELEEPGLGYGAWNAQEFVAAEGLGFGFGFGPSDGMAHGWEGGEYDDHPYGSSFLELTLATRAEEGAIGSDPDDEYGTAFDGTEVITSKRTNVLDLTLRL